ncbi:MAG TPA: DedA family protein/thiosulfate sulfurtransferase GlpE [Pseudomonadales bacterium]|jgi:membrane protein DedA with SNARE-associated domain/rhodanese-related sulfurtransferase|nr:DedA family protein/thiosulfate sulfurtransferase GlpE [Pseudomonadales bacterium]
MTHELVQLITEYGLLVVFINVLMEQIGLPIPAIPTLVVAGALSVAGQLAVVELFLVALVACVIADSLWYMAGRVYGSRVMKVLCRVSLTPDSCVSQTQSRFERWGVNALVVAKFVPGLATIAPPLAGATHIGWPRFLVFNTAGAALWVVVGLGVGVVFNAQIERAMLWLESTGSYALGIVVALLAVYVAYKWWERRAFYAELRMARIGVDELYRLIDEGADPVVVDVRTTTARTVEPRQIPGSLHVPLEAFDLHVGNLPRDRDIVLYCTCPNEASAAQVAKLLIDRGYRRVRPLHGGLDAWIAAGYRIEPLLPQSH